MAEDFRRYPASDTRQLIDYNRFMSLTGEKIFLCLDRGVLEIAKYFLNSRGGWRTTYVKEYGQVGYTMPTVEEFENITQAIAEANLDMASCDDIVAALQGIQGAIEAGSSGGCGCIGSGDTDITDVGDQPDTPIPPGGEWEELGFASEEAYESHRCGAIQYILENYIQTLRNWAGLFGTVGGLTIAVIAGLLLLTVPPAGLMLIVSALGLIAGVDIGLLANLSLIAQEIEDNIDDVRCAMYEATSTAEAADVLRGAAEAAISGLALGVTEAFFLSVTYNLVSNEAVSKIFDPAGPVSETEVDCSDCTPETVNYTILVGTEESDHPSNPFTVLADVNTAGGLCGADGRLIRFTFPVPVTITEITGNSPGGLCGACSGIGIFNYYSVEDFTVLVFSTNSRPQDDTPPSGVRAVNIYQDCDGEFPTLTISYTED